MSRSKILFPGWRYGPNGELELFQCAEDVPDGWSRRPTIKPDAIVEAVQEMAASIAKFDHDGDGRPGGSKRRKVTRRDPR